jgi:hypothetical protein
VLELAVKEIARQVERTEFVAIGQILDTGLA